MGLFGKKAPEPITFADVITGLGYPAGTILREEPQVRQLSCTKTNLPRAEKADCYSATLVNEKNGVTVKVGGKAVARLNPYSLPDAVELLRQHGGRTAPAFVALRDPQRKSDAVYVRVR